MYSFEEASEQMEDGAFTQIMHEHRCSDCYKSIAFDMSARIKAKQDFKEMIKEEEEEEK